ncbi:hypothetical protein CKO13_12055, partial [Halorhodospira neutriphila]|nr:hypothetical protein [Halorhodospira neutriphila]
MSAADPALADWVAPLTRGLAACLDDAGALHEPNGEGPSPGDHYAYVFTALALYEQPQGSDWRLPLRYWLALEPRRRGHAPFNRLGLGLLERRLRDAGAPAEDLALVARGRRACRLRRRYPANNWALLAATVRLLEARTPG